MSHPHPFKWRHDESEIILLCVRWYLRYSLSYRNLEEMMQERGRQHDVEISGDLIVARVEPEELRGRVGGAARWRFRRQPWRPRR